MLLDDHIKHWLETNDDTTLLRFMDTPEYRDMPYEERNLRFITSSKLKAYEECPFAAKLRHVDREQIEEDDEDYFLLGRAVDDYLTYGEEAFNKKYEFVARRSDKSDKIQMTFSHKKIVEEAIAEWARQPMFPKKLKKVNILWLENGYPCKAELDNLEEGIGDAKLVANVLEFEPEKYLFQMAFYHYAVLRRFGRGVHADLFVLDKHKGWSRSHLWRYSVPTLAAQRERIGLLIGQYIGSLQTGLWPMVDTTTDRGRRVAFDSPHYTKHAEFRSSSPSVL